MRRLVLLPVLALLLALVAGMPAASAAPTASYIVVLTDSVSQPAAVASQQVGARGGKVGFVYRHALNGYSAELTAAQVKALRADPRVVSVVPDRVVHVDAQTLPTGIDRVDGELSSTRSGDGAGSVDVDVAIIDTGVDVDHPDLNVVGGHDCVGGGFDDQNGHGTHVAGTVAALDNADGVVGVAPGARIWAVRVLDASGSGTFAQVICGVDFVTANAGTIEVANMSLGATGREPGRSGCSTRDAFHDAICNSVAAGVTYAVAAGNESDDARRHIPAAYDEVITVSALADFNGSAGGGGAPTCRLDQDDTLADFSNFGRDVDIIAPGVCILSTFPGGGLATISGTSMATPHAAGAAGLFLSQNPSASPAQVRTALRNAGTSDWDASDDGDRTQEPLLNVSSF